MLKVLCYGLLAQSHRGPSKNLLSLTARQMSKQTVDPALLARAWTVQLAEMEETRELQRASENAPLLIERAVARTLPLLEDTASVPFVCRYRTDVIAPLSTAQVHLLSVLLLKHASLASLRAKLLAVVTAPPLVVELIQTSTSKTQLEDLYAPFKPPSKGSILEQITKAHPALVEAVEQLWSGGGHGNAPTPNPSQLEPREALVHLLASKIAGEPAILDLVLDELSKHCRVTTSLVQAKAKAAATSSSKSKPARDSSSDQDKYRNYADFSNSLVYLKDHQVLAIRRGVDQKAVKMAFDVDADKMQGTMQWNLQHRVLPPHVSRQLFSGPWRIVLQDAVHDAWTRLLRRRGTSRLWSDKLLQAQERSMQVFEQNLHRALLAPPIVPAAVILAMDPGFAAGIKCAILDTDGGVVRLETVQFLGSNQQRQGVTKVKELLALVCSMTHTSRDIPVMVALGNGHGSQECRALVQEAATACTPSIPINIQLVNEAGASVWSVTPAAKREFPDQPASAIAAISIGRRLQNPLHELVKVPPRSLGLGMYQHDLSEKELDAKLSLTSIDAVATVGVNVNSCSLEILQKVPGLTKLAPKIMVARPLAQRKDLLSVAGLGPKTFENCVAFLRVEDGPEVLDATLVHPESYELARWWLKKLSWKLSDAKLVKTIPTRNEWDTVWSGTLDKASKKFDVSRERVLAVVENLVDSMANVDPRLREIDNSGGSKDLSSAGSVNGCVVLSPELASMEALQTACVVRGITGTIRNIADFGAFVDFGGHSDGLLHTSKTGPVKLSNLLIGEQVGIDILSVRDNRVSLGLTGLDLEPDPPRSQGSAGRAVNSKGRSAAVCEKRRHSTATTKAFKTGKGSSGNSGAVIEKPTKRRRT